MDANKYVDQICKRIDAVRNELTEDEYTLVTEAIPLMQVALNHVNEGSERHISLLREKLRVLEELLRRYE